ncbi:hypothetical protein SAMN04515668_0969 [Hymenobacter arizonensis]|uniref:Uncharacterized protein n=1 Tax=Hymenobacter arizonensis TaxID=1227077 RepID=A0A1I5UKU9_HYMAR|nr:hypothetical protein SAMN04515668_0969 [Hymenobacter arizonensis]
MIFAHAAAGCENRAPREGPADRRGRIAGPGRRAAPNSPPPPNAERKLTKVCSPNATHSAS